MRYLVFDLFVKYDFSVNFGLKFLDAELFFGELKLIGIISICFLLILESNFVALICLGDSFYILSYYKEHFFPKLFVVELKFLNSF